MSCRGHQPHLFEWGWCIIAVGLICLGPELGWTQTQDLATTDDGSRLYFSSTLRLAGIDEYSNSKIFEYANNSYALVAQVVPAAILSDGSVFQFGYRMPNASSDGSIVAFDGTASCSGGPSCIGAFASGGYVIGATLPINMTYWGSLRISHNGRYAVRIGGLSSIDTSSYQWPYSGQPGSLFDFQTGQFVYNLLWSLACTIQAMVVKWSPMMAPS